MASKKYIANTADRIHTYIIEDNRYTSYIPQALLAEAIQKIEFGLDNTSRIITVDLKRVIGYEACIPTTPKDKIVLARIPGQAHPSRIVCYKNPIPTTKLTLDLSISTTGENMDGLLTVNAAYYGEEIKKELNDPKLSNLEKTKAKDYWKNHALCSIAIFRKHQPPRKAIVSKEPNMPGVRTNISEDELCL
jgi:hypothetical protein